MSGKATRADVSVSLQEVPAFQVNSGIDITANAIQGAADEKYQETLDKEAQNQEDKVKDKKDKDKNKNDKDKNNSTNNNSSSTNNNNTPTDKPVFIGGDVVGNYPNP